MTSRLRSYTFPRAFIGNYLAVVLPSFYKIPVSSDTIRQRKEVIVDVMTPRDLSMTCTYDVNAWEQWDADQFSETPADGKHFPKRMCNYEMVGRQ